MERHAIFHVALHDRVLEHQLDLGEIGAVVDAGKLALPIGVVGLIDCNDASAIADGDLDQLGQVQLARGG